jgi:hypothetical protein
VQINGRTEMTGIVRCYVPFGDAEEEIRFVEDPTDCSVMLPVPVQQ